MHQIHLHRHKVRNAVRASLVVFIILLIGIVDQATPVMAAPDISLFKAVSSGVFPGPGAGQFTITYDIWVTNSGTNGSYNLVDTPAFGSGVTIVSANYTRYRFNGTDGPFALATTGPWTLATTQTLNGGRQDLYTLEVVIDPSSATGDALNCTLDFGESGTGTRNTATLSGGGSGSSTVCDPISFQGLTITSFQNYIPLDSNKSCQPGQEGPDAMFYELEIYNTTGATINDIEVTLGNFAAATAAPAGFVGSTALDSGESPTRIIQELGPYETEHLWWYITYPCFDGSYSPPPDWTWFFDVTVDQGGSSFAYDRSLTTRSEISANVASVTSSSLGPGVFLGQIIPYTVTFELGNIGVNQDVYFQPAGNLEFNAACYRLIGLDVTAVSGVTEFTDSITTDDDNDIYFLDVSTSGSGNAITIVYYFLVTCDSGASSAMPFTDIGSGTQYKYSEGDTDTFPNVTSSLSIEKQTLDPFFAEGGGEHTARFVIEITNTATVDVYVDEIVDVLPVGEDIEDPFVTCSTWSGDYTLPPNSREVTQAISYAYPAQNDTGTVEWVGNEVDVIPPPTGEYRVPANDGDNDGVLVLCYTANVQDVAGIYTNTASANSSGTSIGQDTATVVVGDAAMSLEKTGTLDITSSAPTDEANPGDLINYTFTVTNTGNMTLNNISVTDPDVPTITCPGPDSTPPQIATLSEDASVDCTGSYAITQADIDAGLKLNTATADSDETEPVEDDNTEPIPQSPAIDLIKSVTSTGPYVVGDPIDYEFTVENTGNVTLNTIDLSDVQCDSGPTYQSGNTGDTSLLSPGETWTYTCAHTLTGDDFTAGSVVNIAYVTSKLPDDSDGPGDNDTQTVNLGSATLVLRKAWVVGASGDTAELSIDGTNDDSDTSSSSGAPGTEVDAVNVASITIFEDETVNLSELLGVGNTGSYDASLACASSDGELDSILTYTAGELSGSLTLDPDDSGSTVVCTFTNTRETVTLNLDKQWIDAVVDDEADLSLNGINDDLDNNSVADNEDETDSTVATITAYTGETVLLSESLDVTNAIDYTTVLSCSGNVGTLTYTNGALSGSLEIDPADADGTITCTFANTGSDVTLYSVTVEKELEPVSDPGLFDLYVNSGAGPSLLVDDASDGDSGTQGGIAAGTGVTVSESAEAPANLTNYDTTLACTYLPAVGGGPTVLTVTDGAFTMPEGDVTCTFTNTRKSVELALKKYWATSLSGDFTVLTIDDGVNSAEETSTADGTPDQEDIANTAILTVYSGDTVTVSEALDALNTGDYSYDLACNNNGTLTYTPGDAFGQLEIVPADTEQNAITCTFVNTLTEEPVLFDPPSALKVLNADFLPEIEFTMVWINDSNTSAIDVQITDLIPAGTTYVGGSLTCEPDPGSIITSTDTCAYLNGPNRIFWQGTIGPDPGATNATEADNELVITFRVLVPDSVDYVENQGSSVTDLDDDDDFSDETPVSFVLTNLVQWRRDREVPDTGFRPGTVSVLPAQPAEASYNSLGTILLEIPSLNLTSPIVGVPESNTGWDTTWLYNETGWLEGSAFPTWRGNSVLTAHNYTADGLPGPFVQIKNLKYDDQIIVDISGQKYIFAVRENRVILPGNTDYAFEHKESGSFLTLITCEGFNPTTDDYIFRRVVRAVLIGIQ